MKSDMKKLSTVQTLLSQALGCARASMSHSQKMSEVRNHIQQAIHKIDGHVKTQMKKQEMSKKNFEETWKNQAQQAKQPVAPIANFAMQKTLKELNKMITSEERKLEDLEKQPENPTLMNG